MDARIPVIDIGALVGAASSERDAVDLAVMAAATGCGFMVAEGLPADVPVSAADRAVLLRIFSLPEAEKRRLWRQKFDPGQANVYRGWFPLQSGFLTSKEGIDLGADVAYGPEVVHAGDPLREATPLPAEEILPGWRRAAGTYYRAMERVSGALMRSIARGLGLKETFFDAAFARGLSTLRLLRYPLRTDLAGKARAVPDLWVVDHGEPRYIVGAPHVDSGFLTLVAQDGVAGLQARAQGGDWLDVPPLEAGLAVNFGRVLERWSGAKIRATEHRVIGRGSERCSIPFFYEARADAEIGPLPLPGAMPFEPFLFGDYLWATITQFVEFEGMQALRKPVRSS